MALIDLDLSRVSCKIHGGHEMTPTSSCQTAGVRRLVSRGSVLGVVAVSDDCEGTLAAPNVLFRGRCLRGWRVLVLQCRILFLLD